MPVFTCITEVRDSTHVSQHEATDQVAALRAHILRLPYDDGEGPFDDELDWLLSVGNGEKQVELGAMPGARGTWFWHDGASYDPPYTTYIVRTDVGVD